jgi:hypothetical protein
MPRLLIPALAIIGLVALTARPSLAACDMSMGAVQAMPEAQRFTRQLTDLPVYGGGDFAHAGVARAGYLLGRQAEFIHDNPARDALYDCLKEMAFVEAEKMIIAGSGDPALAADPELGRTFQEAMLGILDDEQFARYGIETDRYYPSIFEPDWQGDWQASFMGPKLPGTGRRLAFEATLRFKYARDGALSVEIHQGEDFSGPYPVAAADGGAITFTSVEKGIRHDIQLQQFSDTQFDGEMTMTTPEGNVSQWAIQADRN